MDQDSRITNLMHRDTFRRRDRLNTVVHEASQMDLRDFDRPDWNSFYIPESTTLRSSIQKILTDFCFGPLILQFSDYKWSDFTLDFMAAITNVCTLIPSSLSYAATLAFASNRAGLTSCFIPPIVYSFFGTSRHLSIGPSVLSSIITGSITQNLVLETELSSPNIHRNLSFYTGIVCIGLSFFQAGFLDNVISGYLLSGFISCVAVLLITNQIPTILGMPLDLIADEPIYMKLKHIIENIGQLHLPASALGIGSLIFLFLTFYLFRFVGKLGYTWIHRIPIIFVLILITTLLSYGVNLSKYGIKHIQITDEMRLNDPQAYFLFHDHHMKILKSVLLLTVVGYVEMQSIARANALATGHAVNGNREFFAIGMANFINSFFGGYVTFAATTRSKTLLLNGSKTTMVNFISGILTVIVVYSLGRGLQYVPRPVLAAIVIKSAIVLFSSRDLRFLFKIHAWEDLAMFSVSFLITFCTSIFEGIIFCLVVAVLVIIKKVSFVNLSILGRYRDRTPGGSTGVAYVDIKENQNAEIDDGIMIVSVKGPFLFYNATSFPSILKQLMKEDKRLHNELEKDLAIASSSQTMNMVGAEEYQDSSDNNLTTRSQRLFERIIVEVRRLENAASGPSAHPYILILDFSKCIDIDTTALQTLLHVVRSEKAYETRVILTCIHENFKYKFEKAGIIDLVKEENIYPTIDNAVEILHRSRSFSDIA